MGRRCKICNHPKVVEINEHLIKRDLTLEQIQERYSSDDYYFSISALQRHWQNHVLPEIEAVKQRQREATRKLAEDEYLDTLKALNYIINALPQLIKEGRVSLSHILKAIQLRMQLLGETAQPPEIVIKWGLGLEETDQTDEQESNEHESNEEQHKLEAEIIV